MRPPPTEEPAPQPAPDWREDSPEDGVDGDRWGAPSPYLEERLRAAQSATSRLTEKAARAEETVAGLKGEIEAIDRELGRAFSELDFVQGKGASSPRAVGAPIASAAVPRSASPTAAEDSREAPRRPGAPRSTVAPPPATGSFSDFTVARYNQTVSTLHAQRRSIGWGTVVIAIGISALLLVLTLRANEPLPAIWLAVLPLVWMIPVPFFVAAFRGTQRILRENRLELPEEP